MTSVYSHTATPIGLTFDVVKTPVPNSISLIDKTHTLVSTVSPCYDLFYVIYWYVFSKWRSIRPVEINQYDITMATHYDNTMDNDITRNAHCEITMGDGIGRDTHCDVTMSNDVAMCRCHGITMHNEIAMNLFNYVFSALCLIMILLCSCLISLAEYIHCFCVWLFHSFSRLMKYHYTNTTHVFSPD